METQQGDGNQKVKKGFWENPVGALMELTDQAKQTRVNALISQYNRGGYDEQERQRLLSKLSELGVSSTDNRLK